MALWLPSNRRRRDAQAEGRAMARGNPKPPATAQNRQGRPRARHKQKKASRNHIVVAACQWYASGREAVASRLKEFYISGLLLPCGHGLGRLLLGSCGLALFVAEVEHVFAVGLHAVVFFF